MKVTRSFEIGTGVGLVVCAILLFSASSAAQSGSSPLVVSESQLAGDFHLAGKQTVATLYTDSQDFPVVQIAAEALAADIALVTGTKPKVETAAPNQVGYAVFIGTVGKSKLIDKLVANKKLDVTRIRGKWESFVVTTVPNPLPGVKQGLVIAGSDRRGTAYGVFTLSEAIGVSPWNWWADVHPRRRENLFLRPGTYLQRPPDVKYRGIFINDEDWGIQEWAEKNYEGANGEAKDIGPKTYARVFELLLRLKANYLWPAMHDSTRPFNFYPENKVVADRYAIVMGSSHAEPMLRNNVGEWPHEQADKWNPVTNLRGILDYWEQRVRENGRYENVYTVGMRGIHDSGMPGGGSLHEKRERLEKIIALQREMLARNVNDDPSRVPQIFVPYKEVLEIYQSGLKLPEDITVVWPDDNFGYIRQLPDARERTRAGGHGVYYHISYWGRPHDYLWLESTAPALIWEEMTKAYDLGARQLWVVNVGDIKPIEAGMTLFLKLGWNVKRYGPDVQRKFLLDFYAEQFGAGNAGAIAELKDEYFRLCAVRRPEHMGFNRPNTPVQNSYWTHDEAERFLDRWRKLAGRTQSLGNHLPFEMRDAYFQLVEYPARAGAAMAEKIIMAERARLTGSREPARAAEEALHLIEQLTAQYNAQNGGKWRGMMDHRPRRLPVFDLPPTMPKDQQTAGTTPLALKNDGLIYEIDPTKFARTQNRGGLGWRVIEGLSPRGAAIAVLPKREVPTLRSPSDIRAGASFAEYAVKSDYAGEVEITLEALPTHPFTSSHQVMAAVSINDDAPVILNFDQGKDVEDDPTWQTNVLRNAMFGRVRLRVPGGGAYHLKLWAADPGVVVLRITLRRVTS